MSRFDANSDLDYYCNQTGPEFRLCEGKGCENQVLISAPSVFCAQCEADAAYRLAQQRQRELEDAQRRAS